jgi:hypothetical protein
MGPEWSIRCYNTSPLLTDTGAGEAERVPLVIIARVVDNVRDVAQPFYGDIGTMRLWRVRKPSSKP